MKDNDDRPVNNTHTRTNSIANVGAHWGNEGAYKQSDSVISYFCAGREEGEWVSCLMVLWAMTGVSILG